MKKLNLQPTSTKYTRPNSIYTYLITAFIYSSYPYLVFALFPSLTLLKYYFIVCVSVTQRLKSFILWQNKEGFGY